MNSPKWMQTGENSECRAWDTMWFGGLRGGEETVKKMGKDD